MGAISRVASTLLMVALPPREGTSRRRGGPSRDPCQRCGVNWRHPSSSVLPPVVLLAALTDLLRSVVFFHQFASRFFDRVCDLSPLVCIETLQRVALTRQEIENTHAKSDDRDGTKPCLSSVSGRKTRGLPSPHFDVPSFANETDASQSAHRQHRYQQPARHGNRSCSSDRVSSFNLGRQIHLSPIGQ